MANVKFVEGPPRNDVYVGMLGLTVLSMLLGCAVLALEATDYEWESEPKPRTKLTLPTDSLGAPSANTPAVTPPTPMGDADTGMGN